MKRVILDMNPPNERAVLAKDDAYIEFAWNPSERGVRVTKGIGDSWHFIDIDWDRLETQDMTKIDAREHWIAFKRLGYQRQPRLEQITSG